MSANAAASNFLLGRFSSFYEEIARIKLAILKGELMRLLEPDNPHAEMDPDQMAERIAHRLLVVLDRQSRDVQAAATGAELETYRHARYAMVALADEIFILELNWPGAEHWPEYLLEYTVERTRVAGRRFFSLVEDLMGVGERTMLDADLAAVLLLAMQLGFQGMYRGPEGRQKLRQYRARLYPLASGRKLGSVEVHAFPQAYDYTVVSDRENTRIALAPWLRAAAYGAIGYLVLSSLVWLLLTWSLLDAINGEV